MIIEITSYQALCEDPDNNPAGPDNTMLHQFGLTIGTWDANKSKSQNELAILQENNQQQQRKYYPE